MKETWDQAIWLSKKIEAAGVKIDAVLAALTNIQLVVNGVGNELVGTNVTITDGTNTYQGTFSNSLELTFQLEALGTYTITYVNNIDGSGKVVYDTKDVVIGDYGYYTATVAYFPGYDDWEHWCSLGGVDSADYSGISSLLQHSTALTVLMNVDVAVDYMMLSTGTIMPAVIGSTIGTQALVRSSYALALVKKNMTWRTAIANSDTAKAAIYECSDVIRTQKVSAPSKSIENVGGEKGQINSYTTASHTFTEEDILAIYVYAYVTSNESNTISVEALINDVSVVSTKVNSSSNSMGSMNTNKSGYVSVPENVETFEVSAGANNYNGKTTFSGYATLYYI